MLSYILAFVAVAVIPLLLAGYGERLAILALPEHSRERLMALWIVWGLAAAGILLFGALQWVAFRTDTERDSAETGFKTDVLGKLQKIIDEPDQEKKRQAALSLQRELTSKKGPMLPSHPSAVKDDPLSVPSLKMTNDDLRREVIAVTGPLYAKAMKYYGSYRQLDGSGQPAYEQEVDLLNRFKGDDETKALCARANYLRDLVVARLGETAEDRKHFKVDDPVGLLHECENLKALVMKLPLV